MLDSRTRLAQTEFVILMALMTSLVALAIDSMLPAFDKIGASFSVTSPDQLQLIIAVLFLGFGFGQLVFGPLSDVFGRKPPIYWGLAIFMAGSVLSGFSSNFEFFILGRFLQGFGGAAPRIISLALVRDEYVGNSMARITSLVMTVFILVPAVAPALGQLVLFFAHWRQIFILLFLVSLAIWLWFGIRQPETLSIEKRRVLGFKSFMQAGRLTFSQSTTVACMIVSGLVFGVFVGYLGAVQTLFIKDFDVRELFPMYFAILALAIGSASFFNSRLVMVFGIRYLVSFSLVAMFTLAVIALLALLFYEIATPPLWFFMLYMMATFFCVGFLFGNLNALAMIPLGHVAGIGSALLGFVQNAIAVVVGLFVGGYFLKDIRYLIVAFGTVSFISFVLLKAEKHFSNRAVSLSGPKSAQS